MSSLLHQAEEHEAQAARDRISYLDRLDVLGPRVADVGCGNGYSVAEMTLAGRFSVGVDNSFYRMSRWLSEGVRDRRLVVADAAALPFRSACVDTVISSGMIEHVGVVEEPAPYRVQALPDKHEKRREAVRELVRISAQHVILDFPNGSFPVDFWHGDSLGSFRIHRVPDRLNPSLRELRRYVKGVRFRLLPLRDRLQFHQVSRKRWGAALAPLVRLVIKTLDAAPRRLPGLSAFYPFLVVSLERTPRR